MRLAQFCLLSGCSANRYLKQACDLLLGYAKLCVLAVSLVLCACVSQPDVPLKPEVPAQWRNSNNLGYAPSNIKTWWLSLNDPILNKTVQLALKQNLSLAQALERINAARAFKLATLANEYPNVGFGAGPYNISTNTLAASNSNSSRPTARYLIGFDMLWEVPLFGRSAATHKIVDANIAYAEADLDLRQISMLAEIVNSYGELRAAQDRARILEMTVDHYQVLDKMTQKASAAGLVAETEVGSSRAALNQAKNALWFNQNQREVALQRLSVLCGLTSPMPEWLQSTGANWVLSHNVKPPSTVPADIIRNRPDIKIAEAAVLKAAGDVGIANADLYPKLSIEGLLGITGKFSLESSQTPTDSVTVLAPSIHIPLLDWGFLRQTVNARDAKLRESILAYREAVLLAIEETEVALSNYNAADDRLTREDSELNDLRGKILQARSAFNAGYLNRIELLRMEISMMERQSQYADAKAAWVSAFALANKAMSGNNTNNKK